AKGGGNQRYENRVQELRNAIAAAHILGADKIRIFTFARVADPEPLMPRLAEIVGELARIAEKEKVTLLVENEGSQNISTCAEMAHLVKLVNSRALGINWDPLNGSRREKPFPEGYEILPRKKILNVQVKGRAILPGPDLLDWSAIFARLARDGYKGCVGLETHMGRGDELFQRSHEAMREMRRLAGAVS
ncbi:MAG: sugar phosphate isomerase/epimerase family protein, partial [Bryobacteraceae bacterium]